jgi:eukaryotic-like serine/threonine-protein kinase
VRLDPGATFGRYTIVSLLGEGGMGSVYRALDTKLERPVALKLLRPDRIQDDSHERARGAERLLREAKAAATIAHGNAIAIYDVGEVDETPYIAMELVVGRSLRACIGDATVAIDVRVRWLIQTARALGAAHARGIVHRDVKPENVMLSEDGTIKVLDFGIASSYERSEVTTSTNWAPADYDEWFASFSRDGVLVGTPRYMSPEQLNGASLDGRAAQFSWGVMAYELLAGKPPWLGDTVSYTTLLDLLHKDPTPLEEVAPDVPSKIARAVHRALRKSADERFASMDELISALSPTTTSTTTSSARQWAVMLGVAVASGLGALWLRGSFMNGAPAASSTSTTSTVVATVAPPTMDVPASSPTLPIVDASTTVSTPIVLQVTAPSSKPSTPRDAGVRLTNESNVDAGNFTVVSTPSSGTAAPARFRDPGF